MGQITPPLQVKCKCYRFASVTAFWFARKETKPLLPDKVSRAQNCVCGRGCARRIMLNAPKILDLRGRFAAGWDSRVEKGKGGELGREGEENKGKKEGKPRRGSKGSCSTLATLCPPCKNSCGRSLKSRGTFKVTVSVLFEAMDFSTTYCIAYHIGLLQFCL